MNEEPLFPRIQARDLTGAKRWLPEAFEGANNLVFIAFRREQQTLIDSWTSWMASHAASGDIVTYEVPVIARHWAPLRPLIDGGMAAAIRDIDAQRRTLTVYGDVTRVTGPLGITDRSTISVLLVAPDGRIVERASGGFDPASAQRLLEAAGYGG